MGRWMEVARQLDGSMDPDWPMRAAPINDITTEAMPPVTMDDVLACVDCGASLPPRSQYRCESCVAAAYEQVARGELLIQREAV